jgi:hypothetical protein
MQQTMHTLEHQAFQSSSLLQQDPPWPSPPSSRKSLQNATSPADGCTAVGLVEFCSTASHLQQQRQQHQRNTASGYCTPKL